MAYLLSRTAKLAEARPAIILGCPANGKTTLAGHLDALMRSAELERSAREAPAFLEPGGPRSAFRSDGPDAFDALLCAPQSSPL
jgi:hypothetical protein